LGIKPTYPATGFGYIQKDELKLSDSVYAVKRFVEKPYLGLANSFMKREDFFWNAGIFIWKLTDILTAFKTHLPELFSLFEDSKDSLNTPSENEAVAAIYQQCENISIDFGILEKSENVVIIPANFDWSDLGSWTSAWRSMVKDESGNATAGKNIIMIDSRNCMVQASANKLLLVQGLDDFIIVDTSDALLISHKEKEQEIKTYLSDVKQRTGAQFLYSANYYSGKEESRIF
jgi:mannose-1-phosphate guanylyltransferase